jgi:formylglycine-generating enzyme required for sulfatase activity
MGSDPQQDNWAFVVGVGEPKEQPQCLVTLGAFEIGTYPVTVAEYRCAVETGAIRAPQTIERFTWQKQQQYPDHPVVSITWHDATDYSAWLSSVTGEPWRLPTEAEWEKAARGTDGRIYPWGSQWDPTRVNMQGGGPKKTTTPIGSYPLGVSPYGAYDVAGNVFEWTSTQYHGNPYPLQATDGREQLSKWTQMVQRGGSWARDPTFMRTARRVCSNATDRNIDMGVRLVRGGGTS